MAHVRSRTPLSSLLVIDRLGSVVVSLTVLELVVACGTEHAFRRGGVAVRLPSEWVVTITHDDFVTNPALCFVAEGGGSRVQIREYLPPLLTRGAAATYTPRPAHFRRRLFRRGDVDWTSGKIYAFREHGRVFFIGYEGRWSSSTRDLLDSLDIGRGWCAKPTKT